MSWNLHGYWHHRRRDNPKWIPKCRAGTDRWGRQSLALTWLWRTLEFTFYRCRLGVLIFLLLAGCAGPWYQNRLCADVGQDFYSTLTRCEREWYDWGDTLANAQTWCRQYE
jgi:hypothetical protein